MQTDLIKMMSNDPICYNCRKSLNGRIKKQKLLNLNMYTIYEYENISSLIIRYKDYLDIELARIFLAPYYLTINTLFKSYEIVLVPSSLSMQEHRGFNHLEKMLQDVSLNIVHCLEKSDHIQRFSSARNVMFNLIDENIVFDKVIIFDDIVTSSNSLKAAIDLILPRANKVVVICLIDNQK